MRLHAQGHGLLKIFLVFQVRRIITRGILGLHIQVLNMETKRGVSPSVVNQQVHVDK
jgi:hypothetical protein